MRICIPITAATTAEALIKMEEGFGLADFLELRIDGIRKVNLEKLLTVRKGKLLVTNRVKEEGGAFNGGERERVALLTKAVALGSDYVDLEIRTKKNLINKLKKAVETAQGQTRLILSYHNLERTPRLTELREKMEEGQRGGADIIKIVPFAEKMEDNLKVLALIPFARKRGLEIITFCMGASGKISRIMAPLLGSYLSYASLSQGEESAPGQLTVREMKEVFRILK
ncbi:MAG: type I 3-dehydroquinate dehydratase [Deltaproteobacteria bacterium]|nr:type I 3-dehydroquinate dehydratase [Deltaproteobacteria bacterium]